MRARSKSIAVGACLVAGAALSAIACVNPRDDYDDFVNRTNGVRGVSPSVASDAAPQEAAAIDGGFTNAPFFVACLPHLVGGKLAKAFRFVGTLSYSPTASGSKAGKLDVSLTPLTVGSTDLSATVGTPITASNVAVGPDGHFIVDFGMQTLKGAANPISTNDVVFQSISIVNAILLRSDYACGDLNGHVTSPQDILLDEPDNYCIFEALPSLTGTTPTLMDSQFQSCP